MSLINHLKKSLVRSKSGFVSRLDDLFGSGEINEAFYEELEDILVSGDVGVQTSLKLVDQLKEEIKSQKVKDRDEAKNILLQLITEIMDSSGITLEHDQQPFVILLVGVNGSGKTTSAAKLANIYRQKKNNVLLVAGDTYRAAAIDQLETWAGRIDVDLIKQEPGSDPSALFFDAMNAAKARNVDLVIGDTAGRLHSKHNLMEELSKIHRVISRNMPGAPHQVLLVVDATTGQNAVAQARNFNQSLPIDGLILTKLDGTARGGIVINIQDELKIPVCYVGIGEKIDDLVPFSPEDFARALL